MAGALRADKKGGSCCSCHTDTGQTLFSVSSRHPSKPYLSPKCRPADALRRSGRIVPRRTPYAMAEGELDVLPCEHALALKRR
jgi:hypothetical protein